MPTNKALSEVRPSFQFHSWPHLRRGLCSIYAKRGQVCLKGGRFLFFTQEGSIVVPWVFEGVSHERYEISNIMLRVLSV